MSRKPFRADNWLSNSSKSSLSENGAAIASKRSSAHSNNHSTVLFNGVEQEFSPSSFLIPGWTGEGLISKAAIELKNLLALLVDDAREKFSKSSWTKGQRLNIFNDFLLYSDFPHGPKAEAWIEQHPEYKDPTYFWQEVYNENSPHRELIDDFIQSFCFRSVAIYIFKIRFISRLSIEFDHSLHSNSLLAPNAYLNKFFKKGSRYEIKAESLQVNEYSWFLPSQNRKECILKVTKKLDQISITELMKIFSGETSNIKKQPYINYKDSDYSHTLSHKNFGFLLGDLILTFPKWINKEPLEHESKEKSLNYRPKVLNTHFSGDNMSALTLSHWLSQEGGLYKKWSEIICPEFVSPKYKNGRFLKYCHELQCLYFLIKVAKSHSYEPISFISEVMKQKYIDHLADENGQMSFFQTSETKHALSEEIDIEKAYQRIIINLVKMPRKNPHHYLVQKITQFAKSLTQDGFLYVFSNQKLFVPSQSERVKHLLENYQVVANFSFEELKGKGEIGNYLYIIRKKDLNSVRKNKALSWDSYQHHGQKESCLSFRLSGTLSIFQNFIHLVKGLKDFYRDKDPHKTPIYQKELESNLILEFYQDAIMEGNLLSSNSIDSSHITHPLFFKKLTRSSLYLSHFFQIEALDSNKKKKERNPSPIDFLGITFENKKKYPFILIVDFSSQSQLKVEIIKYESYHAKIEEYGHAFFYYFGLTPKVPQININLFREYFETNIGNQVIQLCLNGGPSQLKSKLKSLLVPKFFNDMATISESLRKKVSPVLESTPETLLSSHPQDLLQLWPNIKVIIENNINDHTWDLLGQLSYFKNQLAQARDFIGDHRLPLESQFKNKLIIEKLLKLETHAIFPHHEHLYIEFLSSNKNELELPLDEVNLNYQDDTQVVELIHSNRVILCIHGPKTLITFIKFVLTSSRGTPLINILQGLQVPCNNELESVLSSIHETQNVFVKLHHEVEELITQVFISKI